jgi:WD40 repeat protein
VRLWDPRTGAARGPAWPAEGGAVLSVSFSLDGSVLATSGSDGIAALWDIGSGKANRRAADRPLKLGGGGP